MTQTAIPFLFMRGGTSRGPYMNRADLPDDLETLADHSAIVVEVVSAVEFHRVIQQLIPQVRGYRGRADLEPCRLAADAAKAQYDLAHSIKHAASADQSSEDSDGRLGG